MTTEQELRALVISVLTDVAPEIDPDAIDPDAELVEQLDIDSMDFLNIVVEINERTGIDDSRARLPEAVDAERRRQLPRARPDAGCMTTTFGAHELEAASLRRSQAPESLGFSSTEEVEPLDGPVGQDRAAEAISFGLRGSHGGVQHLRHRPGGGGEADLAGGSAAKTGARPAFSGGLGVPPQLSRSASADRRGARKRTGGATGRRHAAVPAGRAP